MTIPIKKVNMGSLYYQSNKKAFSLHTYAGWTGNDCLTSINDCHLSACFNSGTCEDLHIAYRCHCLKDFTGEILKLYEY